VREWIPYILGLCCHRNDPIVSIPRMSQIQHLLNDNVLGDNQFQCQQHMKQFEVIIQSNLVSIVGLSFQIFVSMGIFFREGR
jgi:hypothetical protein